MKPIGTILLSVLMVATGQLTLKAGMNKLVGLSFALPDIFLTFVRIFTQPLVLVGFLLFVGSSILWLAALSKSELSFTYPMLSVSYAAVAILSFVIFGEPFSLVRGSGIVIIVIGVFLMSKT